MAIELKTIVKIDRDMKGLLRSCELRTAGSQPWRTIDGKQVAGRTEAHVAFLKRQDARSASFIQVAGEARFDSEADVGRTSNHLESEDDDIALPILVKTHAKNRSKMLCNDQV